MSDFAQVTEENTRLRATLNEVAEWLEVGGFNVQAHEINSFLGTTGIPPKLTPAKTAKAKDK